ncbi:CAP domain-containing protein [Nitriliruptoraceae bacterium ZYF776]|nr:CAP domain-containing protein [Profundirhabdus halotolerans]
MVLVAVTCTLVASGQGAPAAASPSDAEREIAALLHAERASAGLGAVVRDPELDAVARAWSQRQAEDGTRSHNPALRDQVGDARAWYENVGDRTSDEDAVTASRWLHDAWMASDGHRANILRDPVHDVGIGVARQGRTLYATVVFRERRDGGAGFGGDAPPSSDPGANTDPSSRPAPDPPPADAAPPATEGNTRSGGGGVPSAPSPDPDGSVSPEADDQREGDDRDGDDRDGDDRDGDDRDDAEPDASLAGPPTSETHTGATHADRDHDAAADRRRAAIREADAAAGSVTTPEEPHEVQPPVAGDGRSPLDDPAATAAGAGPVDPRGGSLATAAVATVAMAALVAVVRRRRDEEPRADERGDGA